MQNSGNFQFNVCLPLAYLDEFWEEKKNCQRCPAFFINVTWNSFDDLPDDIYLVGLLEQHFTHRNHGGIEKLLMDAQKAFLAAVLYERQQSWIKVRKV